MSLLSVHHVPRARGRGWPHGVLLLALCWPGSVPCPSCALMGKPGGLLRLTVCTLGFKWHLGASPGSFWDLHHVQARPPRLRGSRQRLACPRYAHDLYVPLEAPNWVSWGQQQFVQFLDLGSRTLPKWSQGMR